MVKNGYILNVSTNNIASFLDKVRLELKDVIREQVLMQTAKSTEWLYDMKFIEQRKYDASILDMALAMTAQRISGVALGAFKDSLFDFRSTLIFAKSDPDHQFQYVLLNAANNFIRYGLTLDTSLNKGNSSWANPVTASQNTQNDLLKRQLQESIMYYADDEYRESMGLSPLNLTIFNIYCEPAGNGAYTIYFLR